MTATAAFAFPAEAYPLGESVRVPPGTRVELERLVPTGDDVLPYLWVRGASAERFHDHLRRQPAVEHVEVVHREGPNLLLRVAWRLSPGSLLRYVTDEAVALVSAAGTADGWVVELRGDRSALRGAESFCERAGIEVRLARVYGTTAATERESGLTRLQYETLARAFEAGYFEEPRRVTLEELAADLDVSPRAVSRRLRRGVANVLRARLGESD